MRTYLSTSAIRTAAALRAEPKDAARSPERPRPVQANRLVAVAQPARGAVHRFASLALDRSSDPPPLPHETWHVVQQRQGHVKPTLQLKGATINGNAGFESGSSGIPLGPAKALPAAEKFRFLSQPNNFGREAVVQRKVEVDGEPLQKAEDFSEFKILSDLQKSTLQEMVGDNVDRKRSKVELMIELALADPSAHTLKYTISPLAVAKMIAPIARGEASSLTSRTGKSGVEEGEVGSYKVVQYLEKIGDGLTGDHQPSGAAVKEALREALHLAKQGPLTRGNAANAYKRAITVVVDQAWHLASSRTYGGRNTPAQINQDARDLYRAALEDFKELQQYWKDQGRNEDDILEVWKELDDARQKFFATGEMQAGSMAD